jgi:hypothetical protein
MLKIRNLVQTCVPAILAGLLWGCDAPKALEPDTVSSNNQQPETTTTTSGYKNVTKTTRTYWVRTEERYAVVWEAWKDSGNCKEKRLGSQQYRIIYTEVVQRLKNGDWVNDRDSSLDVTSGTDQVSEERPKPGCGCNPSNYMVISPLETDILSVDGSIPMNNNTFLFPSNIDPDGEPTYDCHDQGTSG